MKAIVTCGPSYEPVDQVRRLTNSSTGRLGITLANALTDAGLDVICLKGEGATCTEPLRAGRLLPFTTNDDVARQLEALSRAAEIGAVFHAAALCDFRAGQVTDPQGNEMKSAKFATRDGRLLMELVPATKVLPQMRAWFPRALIVGWKYELAGTRADAFARAQRQIQECRTDACVLNGAAYGQGFALCRAGGAVRALAGLKELCEALLALLRER